MEVSRVTESVRCPVTGSSLAVGRLLQHRRQVLGGDELSGFQCREGTGAATAMESAAAASAFGTSAMTKPSRSPNMK